MIRAEEIRGLRTAAPDYQETEAIKSRLRELRETREPFYLTAQDLDPIFRWKLRGQYERNRQYRDTNTDAVYRAVTQAAFAVREPDGRYEAEVRLRVLSALRGVGVPVASAILALTEPDRYCVIDFRGWRAVFEENRNAFDVSRYLKYRSEVLILASQLGWPVQETDLAIWTYDEGHGGHAA